MHVYQNVLEMIGNTPMVKVSNIDTGPCELYLKLELLNPGGSIKDRIAVSMIEAAEQQGKLRPGMTIIEATAGNTGLGLALVAASKGYPLKIVMPDKMSAEKVNNLKAMGAEVIRTRSDVGKGHPEYYQDMAERLAAEHGWFYVNQFTNPANVAAHYRTTGPEIWQQMQGQLDAFVCGVGSGGTLSGIGSYLREQNPQVDLVLADPEGSILEPLINRNEEVTAGSWLVEGIGEDFVPDICQINLANKAYAISDKEAFHTARELLVKEGVMVGSSSGTLIAAALRYCREQTSPKRVVTLACDTGNRYLSKLYNDDWMAEKGLLEK
ncbi:MULTISPECIES: PLP-dependent cysteine synthase family protein [Idiomarinaceae]|uniref:Cysteine synthase B n=4 Tax=Pseudidiomarina TaxID=2800384 RepID=A0A368UL60_9GAMM|nr:MULTISPECIES: cysteine synthase family protein [Idiomarinaceae]MDT7526548.1 cysteine synthase family protein [Pseudidiomarina sp. GXY010]MDX1526338.1 cysteine synthase family protein [Pseudidiomarina maritima]MRJ42845.1 pyridoxal-phosphate dependent enzyme [Idiomarina sp. FeN1]NCU58395.1 pyridoxal-phosphate dependent enzyme [Idiomarina sp. FenA--70]NCU61093.1 pyridoxal-phosphate dependent enzyme [Idiomarina sp. FenBw--71]